MNKIMARLLEFNTANLLLGYAFMIFCFIYQAVSSFVQFFVPRWLCSKRKDIRGQTILITGAGSGVGRQLALQFSKHATCLILVDINRQWLLQTEKLLDRRSPVFIYDCDVSDYKKVCEMAEKVKRDAGDVDILVNNAGIVAGQYLEELSEDKISRMMGVNVLAHFWTVKAFLPSMMKRNFGHLVSVVSIAGKAGAPKLVDYCTSKYAAMGFAESLAVELKERKLDGIKITIVCPAHIDTGLFEGAKLNIGTIMTPEYVAKEIVLGVLEEQETIYLPHFLKFLVCAKDVGTTMTPEYVAKEVVLGVLQERESIHLPSYIDLVYAAKECIPRWFGIKIGKMSGAIKTMEHFTGRYMNGVQMNEVHKPVKID